MYTTLYNKKISDAVVDNRIFIKPNSLIYEAPPKLNPYRDETMEEKMFYSYPQPTTAVENDIYSFRYDDFSTGNRDFEVDVVPKFYTESPKSQENFQYGPDNVKIQVGQEKIDISGNNSHHNNEVGVCGMDDDGTKNICGGNNLFPILDARFNLREAAKNMILLEDHLFHYGKRCQDCILKHCLTIEGFLEEAVTLDKKREYHQIINESLEKFREIFKEIAEKVKSKLLTDEDCCRIAQNIRTIRKPLCQQFATFIK